MRYLPFPSRWQWGNYGVVRPRLEHTEIAYSKMWLRARYWRRVHTEGRIRDETPKKRQCTPCIADTVTRWIFGGAPRRRRGRGAYVLLTYRKRPHSLPYSIARCSTGTMRSLPFRSDPDFYLLHSRKLKSTTVTSRATASVARCVALRDNGVVLLPCHTGRRTMSSTHVKRVVRYVDVVSNCLIDFAAFRLISADVSFSEIPGLEHTSPRELLRAQWRYEAEQFNTSTARFRYALCRLADAVAIDRDFRSRPFVPRARQGQHDDKSFCSSPKLHDAIARTGHRLHERIRWFRRSGVPHPKLIADESNACEQGVHARLSGGGVTDRATDEVQSATVRRRRASSNFET